MDILTLKSIQFSGKHGVYDNERKQGNRFELDVVVSGDFKPAAVNDDLSLAVNYESIEEIARQVMAGPSRLLIESLCHEIGTILIDRIPGIHSLELALRKLSPPLDSPVAYAEIRMTWHR